MTVSVLLADDQPLVRAGFRLILEATPRNQAFGNGRFARNLLEEAIGRHAWRLQDVADPTVEQLRGLLPEDSTGDDDEPEPGNEERDAPAKDVAQHDEPEEVHP
jgi:hypothetical protein